MSGASTSTYMQWPRPGIGGRGEVMARDGIYIILL